MASVPALPLLRSAAEPAGVGHGRGLPLAVACFAVALMLLVAGCATPPPASDPEALAEYRANNDPLEPANRAIHAFNEKGLPESLQPGSKHPHTVHRAFDPEQAEALGEMLHQDPRKFGKGTSLWTLDLAAEVSFEEGLTKERITGETIRATLARLGVRWERAKRWITSPDPEYQRKTGGVSD